MKCDIILSGVGGQGVLSVAAIISQAAVNSGMYVRQSEVHGMAQRGGAVVAHMRLSDEPIASDLIMKGSADVLLSMEPLESLRYLEYLSESGWIITAAEGYNNIPNYPDLDKIKEAIRVHPNAHIVDAKNSAKQAGSPRAMNVVLVGAAAKVLPVSKDALYKAVEQRFSGKGDKVNDINKKALKLGLDS